MFVRTYLCHTFFHQRDFVLIRLRCHFVSYTAVFSGDATGTSLVQ